MKEKIAKWSHLKDADFFVIYYCLRECNPKKQILIIYVSYIMCVYVNFLFTIMIYSN